MAYDQISPSTHEFACQRGKSFPLGTYPVPNPVVRRSSLEDEPVAEGITDL